MDGRELCLSDRRLHGRLDVVAVDELEQVARWSFTFSPRRSTEEVEECAAGLDDVSVVELRIDPDVRHSADAEQVYASITSFWLA